MRMKRSEVDDHRTFANYIQQELGVGYPANSREWGALSSNAQAIFDLYPQADWPILTGIVEWARNRNKKFAFAYQLVSCYRYALVDGYLPELERGVTPAELELQEQIEKAIEQEPSKEWRYRLLGAERGENQRRIYEWWASERAPALQEA